MRGTSVGMIFVCNVWCLFGDVGTDEEQKDATDVLLNVACRKSRTIFEMRPGIATTNLVSAIFQAIEGKSNNLNLERMYFV